MNGAGRTLKLGVAGLGRAFTLMLPGFRLDPRIELVAAVDPRAAARSAFTSEFGCKAYDTVHALAADPEVEAVYVATPHQMHAAHVIALAQAGKHVLVEKPMALSLGQCDQMIAAAAAARVQLIVGHSHSFDAPIARTRTLIGGGAFGTVQMIHAMNYGDFLYRPRRPEELDTGLGGGVIFSQAAHQVDIVRLLAGSAVRSVRAHTCAWDRTRPVEGAYSALLSFESGAFASLTYSGYAHFDSAEFCNGFSELGGRKELAQYGSARRVLAAFGDTADEAAFKSERGFGGSEMNPSPPPVAHEHFGSVLVSCQRADLRPLPDCVIVYGDAEQRREELPAPRVPRAEVIDELYAAVVNGVAPLHDGRWARGTLEVCLAILQSARLNQEIAL